MKTVNWENVYLFISSTFNDMHAERDYLIKRVFPELRTWCSKRRLKLLDIDLRWGVSEADAQENKRVVDVCMRNIDRCRPFFLCLLGQRRGWVPELEDVNEETLHMFPGLVPYLGKNSITELEVIHALKPLDAAAKSVRHALFCFREPSYLEDIGQDEVCNLFSPNKEDEMEHFKEHIFDEYGAILYSADWNEDAISPELKNIGGRDLSKGRLGHFRVGEQTFGEAVLVQLKEAIGREFPEHMEIIRTNNALEEELNAQSALLFSACEAYITRESEEQKVTAYLNGDETAPYIICADAGSGKTSLLAHLIQTYEGHGEILYRFIGTGGESTDMERTIELLVQELLVKELISEREYQHAAGDITGNFMELLGKAAKRKKVILVLDGLDQWERMDQKLTWLPSVLPENVRLVLSVRKSAFTVLDERISDFSLSVHELPLLTAPEDKRAMIRYFLGQFLKAVDEKQLESLIQLPGSSNPLYLKIVLNELRMFGSFEQLREKLNTDYGKTPEQAFKQILLRLEKEAYADNIESEDLTRTVLAMMACSLEGIRISELVPVFQKKENYASLSAGEILDDIYALLRHLDMYLTVDGEYADFRYDSFRRAAKLRYALLSKKRGWNGYLAEIYEKRCRNETKKAPDFRRNLLLLGHHALNSAPEVIARYFKNAEYIYYLLQENGARLTAEYLRRAERKGVGEHYMGKIAALVERESAQLTVNAGLLFYFLSLETEENPLADELISRAAEKLSGSYLRPVVPPVKRDGGELAHYRETFFPDDGIRRDVFVAGKYLVTVLRQSFEQHQLGVRDSICIQNLEDEQTVFTCYASGDIKRCVADEHYLYLRYETQEEMYCFEILSLPHLTPVSKTVGVPAEIQKYTFADSLERVMNFHGYKGVWYVLAEKPGEGFRVYRLSDGALICECACTKADIQYEIVGRFVKGRALENQAEEMTEIIWNLFTGEEIERVYDAFASMAADENTLYIFESLTEKFLARIYTVQEHTVTFCEEKILPKKVGYDNPVLGKDSLLLFGLLDDVTILDRKLNVLGYCRNGLDKVFRARRIYLHGRDILYITEDRLKRFRKQHLIGRMDAGIDYSALNSSNKILKYKDKIYSMGSKTVVLDMKTHSSTEYAGRDVYEYSDAYTAAEEPVFCKIGGIDAVAGYAALQEEQKENESKRYVAAVQRLDTLETILRLPFEIPKEYIVEGVGYDNLLMGVLATPEDSMDDFVYLPDPCRKHPEKKSLFWKKFFRSYRVSLSGAERLTKEDLPVTAQGYRLLGIPGIGTFLVAVDVYLDERRRAIRLYDMSGKLVLSEEYFNSSGVIIGRTCVVENCIYYTMTIGDSENTEADDRWENRLIEIDLEKKSVSYYPIGYDSRTILKIVGSNRKELILESGEYDGSFHIFDLQQKRLTGTVKTKGMNKIYNVLHKYGCYMCQPLQSKVWQVYSEAGDYLFSQLMPEVIGWYAGDEGDLCIVNWEGYSKKTLVFYCIGSLSELG